MPSQNTAHESSNTLKENVKVMTMMMVMTMNICNPAVIHVTGILDLESIVVKLNTHMMFSSRFRKLQ